MAAFRKPGKLRVAVIQMCSTNDKIKNMLNINKLVNRALIDPSAKPDLICLPECAIFVGRSRQETVAAAEILNSQEKCPIDLNCDQKNNNMNPVTDDLHCINGLREIASTNEIFISVGGFPEKDVSFRSGGKIFNSHVMIDSTGVIISPIYRKIHLFDCPLAGLFESESTEAGNELVLQKINDWNIGLTVCYDLRFPPMYEALRRHHAAEVFLVPSAFNPVTGKAHWEVLLRARAIENQCYVIAAAQAGEHSDKRSSYGHTIAIDPWGKVIGELDDKTEGVLNIELDKEHLLKVRQNMPVFDHQRLDTYCSTGNL